VPVRRPTRSILLPRRLPSLLLPALTTLALGCDQAASENAWDAMRSGSLADPGALEGRYELRIATLLDGGTRTSHHVKTDDGVYEIVLTEPLAEPIEYDSWVRVPGQALEPAPTGSRWEADELEVVAPPPQPLIDPELRLPRRIGTVLTFWDGQGMNNGTATDSMFTGNKSTNVYYGENSYGIETMAGKVFGPYQITMPGGCNVDNIVSQGEAAMIDKGHDPTQFRQMMFYFPSGLGCDFAGLASIGSPDNPARNSWYAGSFGCTTRNQELGHNYGMGHSHAYSCPATPDGFDHNPYEDCEHVEYGHPYDPMGNGCGHMNVVQKTFMGWIEGCNIVTATSSGTFNLVPNELPCNGTQALRFPAYDGRYYYLEYRTGIGQFPAGSGVLINLAGEVQGFGPPNYVLDELGANTNGYLHEGESFTDPNPAVPVEERASFTVLEEHDTHVVIQVTLPNGGDGAPPTCREGGEPIVDESNGNIGTLECAAEPYPGDESPPIVQITYPTDGMVFEPGSDFTITADATDDRGVIEVELYLDGEPFDVRTEPPWEWEATNIPEGTYEFGVVARDARLWTPSNAVTVVVGTPSADESGTSGGNETGVEPPASTGDSLGTTGDGSSSGGDAGLFGGGPLDDGCNCRQAGERRGGAGFMMMLLGLGWLRRRRRGAA
jgi:MYXO-CTERM domain-containing protein